MVAIAGFRELLMNTTDQTESATCTHDNDETTLSSKLLDARLLDTSGSRADSELLHGDPLSRVSSLDGGEIEEHVTPPYVPGSFEGPEKTLEVCFRPGVGVPEGLRSLTRVQLDFLCTLAKCTILSHISSNYIDAYLLSESSLFIYKDRLIMKTCGTTTLLRCLNTLLQYADDLGMELNWCGYSRKNLNNPGAQLWPHSSFGDEIKYLSQHEHLCTRLHGTAHILGPVTGDHWFVFVADHSEVPHSLTCPNADKESTINMMMFDMAPEVASIFYQDNTPGSGREMTVKSGIYGLVPGAAIDETAFSPCGYSMNSILHDVYCTIHVTPEAACSYASYETNSSLDNYTPVVRNVLNVFKPQRFVLTLFGDEFALASMAKLPTNEKTLFLPGLGDYVRTSLSSTRVENDLSCLMACYSLETPDSPVPFKTTARSSESLKSLAQRERSGSYT